MNRAPQSHASPAAGTPTTVPVAAASTAPNPSPVTPAGRIAQMLPWLLWAALVVALDQLTKNWILQNYQLHDSTVVTSFFSIVRAHNTGAAFSFLAGADGWQRWFFVGIAAVATAVILWQMFSHPGHKLMAFALSGILGGAIGNVVDRLMHGYVVDFLDFYAGGRHFPAFNVADSAITLGAVCLIADELLRMRRDRLAAGATAATIAATDTTTAITDTTAPKTPTTPTR